ncbi:MAG TPA: sodium:proton antiporter [Bacteroidales bacterium]|nr:MAG: sodium:proton antiporter [Bacteroidetes bacterium GWF2_35_48]OFY92993.1 MAG: sodium:proton antiporter [Bacteroidetes bacterium RIFOXYC12_FULL_35_7]HBX50189.1 sodium:proton antiporter [Bacteroidales bacterium]
MLIFLTLIFIFGYIAIATEHTIKVNKAASALFIGVATWAVYILMFPGYIASQPDLSHMAGEASHYVTEQLAHHLSEIAQILFFLMGAMTIVELVDAHDGFDVITSKIRTKNKRTLLWIISIVTFFLSAVLDNLTTTIVMISLARKLIKDHDERLFVVGMIVIAANAGGAWSPIGDVTTTMLWIGGQITTVNIILKLIIPSIVCLVIPLIVIGFRFKGNLTEVASEEEVNTKNTSSFEKNLVFILGISGLVFVPIFKTITHLPPYMGMLISLSILWIVTEIMHKTKNEEDKTSLSVIHALRKIDMSSILFFLGILLCVASLASVGILDMTAQWLNDVIGNQSAIVMSIGVLSSIVDNVPLVAGAIGMYPLSVFPTDHFFWEFLAYAAGTGGSILIIGSAAGVAAMGMEKINFFWYIKKISPFALIGYFAGSFAYILLEMFLH